MPLRPTLLALVLCLAAGGAGAQEATPAAAPPGGAIAVELNTLRQVADGCQAFFVVRNDGAAIAALELDAFMFGADDVIADRLALPFPPIPADKMKVMVFDLDLGCSDVARVFVNEVLACTADDGPCAGRIAFSSRATAKLSD